MKLVTVVIVSAAVIHIAAGIVEMTSWPWFAEQVAGIAGEHGEATKVAGWNQGLYNLMLAAGLLFATFKMNDGPSRVALQKFCLICFCVAGIGALYSMGSVGALFGQTGVAGLALWLLYKYERAET